MHYQKNQIPKVPLPLVSFSSIELFVRPLFLKMKGENNEISFRDPAFNRLRRIRASGPVYVYSTCPVLHHSGSGTFILCS